ncbi:MAG: NAD-dependent epimerase/dehydratase family protein [Gemmatimonadota bacterium]|nr:NAD-dependent epimerase/dehydratase family protein [Gemmatimonadota bacterium]
MPTALVTGATGQVGRHVVERLHRDGWSVRALVRDLGAAALLRELDVELVLGDVLDERAFSAAAAGREVILHTAAAVTPSGGWEAFRRPNVDGTRNAVAAAMTSGARLVHVSSVAVYGGTGRYRDGVLTDETSSLAPLADGDFYARSKRESEAIVMEACRLGQIWATAVRPDVIYGRYDRQFVPRIARLMRTGFAPVIGDGSTTLAIVHAESVADGMVRAAMNDLARGRAYNLANDFDCTAAEFFRLASKGLGIRVRMLRMPYGLAKTAERAVRRIASAVPGSRAQAISFSAVDFLGRSNPFTSERARNELGWDPQVRPADGVPDAFAWSAAAGR